MAYLPYTSDEMADVNIGIYWSSKVLAESHKSAADEAKDKLKAYFTTYLDPSGNYEGAILGEPNQEGKVPVLKRIVKKGISKIDAGALLRAGVGQSIIDQCTTTAEPHDEWRLEFLKENNLRIASAGAIEIEV